MNRSYNTYNGINEYIENYEKVESSSIFDGSSSSSSSSGSLTSLFDEALYNIFINYKSYYNFNQGVFFDLLNSPDSNAEIVKNAEGIRQCILRVIDLSRNRYHNSWYPHEKEFFSTERAPNIHRFNWRIRWEIPTMKEIFKIDKLLNRNASLPHRSPYNEDWLCFGSTEYQRYWNRGLHPYVKREELVSDVMLWPIGYNVGPVFMKNGQTEFANYIKEQYNGKTITKRVAEHIDEDLKNHPDLQFDMDAQDVEGYRANWFATNMGRTLHIMSGPDYPPEFMDQLDDEGFLKHDLGETKVKVAEYKIM